jgi:hypothetical protein
MPALKVYQPPVAPPPHRSLPWRAGDLVPFYGREWKSRVIEWGTRGPSHIGIILEAAGRLLLYESTTLCDLACELTGKLVRGVQAHTPEKRIAAYDGLAFRMPLRVPLSAEETNRLTNTALRDFPPGTPYDLAGALASGPRLKHWRWLLPYPDLGSMFCSGLCARLLQCVNRMNWHNPTCFSPGDLVRNQLWAAVHGKPESLAWASEAAAA